MKQMNHTGSVNSKKAAAAKRLLKQKRMGLTLMLVSLALVGVLTGLGMEDATIAILLFPLGPSFLSPGSCGFTPQPVTSGMRRSRYEGTGQVRRFIWYPPGAPRRGKCGAVPCLGVFGIRMIPLAARPGLNCCSALIADNLKVKIAH
ncbi:MAG: hypothetical protein ACLRVT_07150 [Oscillospiraceae bacterium]